MASSNPFRRKPTVPTAVDRFPALDAIDAAGAPPPPTSFRTPAEAPEEPATRKKMKPVKKVRVLSPPPLSADPPEWSYQAPMQPASERYPDIFGGVSIHDSGYGGEAVLQHQQHTASSTPANPFSRTLHDFEDAKELELEQERKEEGAALKAANSGKGALDVDSFKRLLMAGVDVDTPNVAPNPGQRWASAANYYQSEDENTRLQGERGKKPPPPPSSRHGRSIKSDSRSANPLGIQSPLEVNKTMSHMSARNSFEESIESPFGEDASRKTMGSDPPTNAKKPIPAPPPRRGHARAQSRAESYKASDEPPSRSSMESGLSRSNSVRSSSNNLPAPPPPRRPQATLSKQSPHPSPTTALFNATTNHSSTPLSDSTGPAQPVAAFDPLAIRDPQSGNIKLSAPPPPPARNPSTRRPASIHRTDSTRRVLAESKGSSVSAPPPPPRRQGVNNRMSIDSASQRSSIDSTRKLSPGFTHESSGASMNGVANLGAAVSPTSPTGAPGTGIDILADLEALQREVDALRGVK